MQTPDIMQQYQQAIIKPKKQLFLGAYFIYVLALLFIPSIYPPLTNYLGAPLAVLMFAAAGLIMLSMGSRKIFIGRVNVAFFGGISLWIYYGFFLHLSGLSLYTTLNAYIELATLLAFTLTLLFVSRIIITYGWKLEMIKMFLLGLGISLIAAYVINFDSFAIMKNLGSVFDLHSRYRFSFGLGHANRAGKYAAYFLAYSFVYRAAAEEKGLTPRMPDKFRTCFLVPASLVALIILLSSGSRASITSLILFFLVYSSLTFYSKLRVPARIMAVAAAVIIAVLVVWAVDWDYVFKMSNREVNYKSLDVIFSQNAWLTGLGFIRLGELFSAVNLHALDSFYLTVFLQSGLIGFVIFYGTIFWYTIMYFKNPAGMTKFQRMAGGLLAVGLYYAIFESSLYGHGYLEMTSWSLLITEMHQMTRKTTPARETSQYASNPVKYSTHILHNS